jgi:hypothetical protein
MRFLGDVFKLFREGVNDRGFICTSVTRRVTDVNQQSVSPPTPRIVPVLVILKRGATPC